MTLWNWRARHWPNTVHGWTAGFIVALHNLKRNSSLVQAHSLHGEPTCVFPCTKQRAPSRPWKTNPEGYNGQFSVHTTCFWCWCGLAKCPGRMINWSIVTWPSAATFISRKTKIKNKKVVCWLMDSCGFRNLMDWKHIDDTCVEREHIFPLMWYLWTWIIDPGRVIDQNVALWGEPRWWRDTSALRRGPSFLLCRRFTDVCQPPPCGI